MKAVSLFFAFCALASAAFAERQPLDRYQSIIDRQMFGPLPPGFDPTKMPSEVQKSSVTEKQLTQEEEKLKSSIHFSVINVTPDGQTAVGFTDKSDPKTPVHYYLKVGEKRNGWEVKAADAAEASMTIAKGEIEVSLKIGGDSTKDANATTKAGAAQTASNRPQGGLLGGSLGARRRLRQLQAQEEKKKADEAAAQREAERQAQAEADKVQREQERAEQRQQLQAIQEELKRVREARARESEKAADAASGD